MQKDNEPYEGQFLQSMNSLQDAIGSTYLNSQSNWCEEKYSAFAPLGQLNTFNSENLVNHAEQGQESSERMLCRFKGITANK